MYRKKMKLFKRIVAMVCVIAMQVTSIPANATILSAAGGRKIDVWDFGGVQESNTTLYTNNITAADWDNCANVGADAKFVAGTTTFGDLTITHNANDRLYSTSGKNYGSNALGTTKYGDGYQANGMYYCNGTGGDTRRFITIDNVVAGDKIYVYMASSNDVESTLNFTYTGTAGTQNETATFRKEGKRYAFVAEYDGSYKIWTDGNAGKPIYNRVVRFPGVEVTGTIDFGTYTGTGHTVKFVNDTTGKEVAATLNGSGFSAILAPGYDYTAVFSGATGFGFANATKVISVDASEVLTGKANVALSIVSKSTYVYSGNITGFDEAYDISKLAVKLVPPADTAYDAVVMSIDANMAFSATLEPDVTYTLEMTGVNDYEITSAATIYGTDTITQDITVALKATQAVTGNFIGNGTAVVTGLTFTNVSDNYVYPATVNGNSYSVSLRNGSYVATAAVDNYTTTTHVVVKDAAVNKDLMFVYNGPAESLTWASDLYVGYANQAHNYKTVNEAVDAAKAMNPTSEAQRITIHIAPGTYREQIIVDVPYLTFINDEADKEVLLTWYYGIGYVYYSADATGFYNAASAYDKYEKNAAAKWGAATFIAENATGFRAENITFESSFNRYITDEEIEDGVACGEKNYVRKYGVSVTSKDATERAAALYVGADQTEFYNCKMYSSQDTLYTGKGTVHSYYKNCFIEGNTDYIFGDGNIVFDNCELSQYGYTKNSTNGYITAAKDEATLGYLFRNCTVTPNKTSGFTVKPTYWGRPWGAGAKVTFVNTQLKTADMILAKGWTSMSGNNPENANYVEYNTTSMDGNKVNTSSRVSGTVYATAPTTPVTDYFGSWTPHYYVAESATVAFETTPYVIDNGDINAPMPGHTFTVGYSLGTANDANDVSVINWYRVNGSTETLVKSSAANVDKTYKLVAADAGCYIKVEVIPKTASGNTGTKAAYQVEEVVREGYEDPSGGGNVVTGDGINIFLAGDSTVKDYSAEGMYNSGNAQNMGSWGEFFQSYFDTEKVTVLNYANGGRSVRNFLNEGSLDKILANIGEGDYLFIQFGHNDCSNGSGYLLDRYVPLGTPDKNGVYPTTAGTKVVTPSSLTAKYGDTYYSYDCGGTFKWYLTQYIDAAKAKGLLRF